ncbi:MAG: hypothetical protein BroJett024_37690 [Alphaproteobacteria bacterium]|nr:MAG: hypothetical protein BroJett024_37690 [Alphaproteobacteria bacterium]
MTPQRKRADVIADNRLALNAGWDEEILAGEPQALLDIDLDFDISVIGFSIAEIDGLVEGATPQEPGDPVEDRLPDEGSVAARCRPSDLWQLGRSASSAAMRSIGLRWRR